MPQLIQELKQLSFSSRELLNSCERKYALRKINHDGERETGIDLTFGSVVGNGVANLFLPLSEQQPIELKAFADWNLSLDAGKPKAKKSFSHSILAIERFAHQILPYYEGYKLIGAEVGVYFKLPNGYCDRGFVDVVLISPQNVLTIIEIKTTSAAGNYEAKFKNSSQTDGYALAAFLQDRDAYSAICVDYLVYNSTGETWTPVNVPKTPEGLLEFQRSLAVDVSYLDGLITSGFFPKRGNACTNWGRTCQFFGVCDEPFSLQTELIQQPEDMSKFRYILDFTS